MGAALLRFPTICGRRILFLIRRFYREINGNAERAELANGVKSEHPALVAFTKHQNIDQLSRELLVELIDHIKVYENGNISVRFKFADEFRRIAEYIEINTTKPAVAG